MSKIVQIGFTKLQHNPIEEVNSYYGLIIGLTYNFLFKDRIIYDEI